MGEAQLRWFNQRLAALEDQGWLRVGLVHHNVLRGAEHDDENLRDADTLERILAPHLDLLLHGHTHNARLSRLGNGLVVLSTGSAALKRESRPPDVPNQYQVLRFEPGGVRRWARRYEPGQKRWTGDARVSDRGDDWRVTIPTSFQMPGETPEVELVGREPWRVEPAREDFLDRVAEVARLRMPGVEVSRRTDGPVEHLRVASGSGGIVRVQPVGSCVCSRWEAARA